MNISLEKLVPRAVVAAALAYCGWPSMSYLMSQPPAAVPATLPEIAKSALAPVITAPTRDPFMPKAVAEGNAGAKPGLPNGQRGADTAQKEGKAGNPLGGLKLEATYLSGPSRLAIINGHVYGPTETLPASKLKILDVLPYQVILECEGKRLTLAYADTASARSASALSKSRPTGSGAGKPKGGIK
jgi:hypothetical protein